MGSKDLYLRIYLNDHLAGSTLGEELAKRCLRANRGSDLGAFLSSFLDDLQQDRSSLRSIMGSLRVPESKPKVMLAWTGEKIGRLKLNGNVRGYSDLSRLVELEGLCLGVEGKLSGWLSLIKALGRREVGDEDLDRLVERASSQRRDLERHRVAAAARALS